MMRRLLLAACLIALATPAISAEPIHNVPLPPIDSRKVQYDADGNSYVLDHINHRIVRFDANGRFSGALELTYLNVTSFVVRDGKFYAWCTPKKCVEALPAAVETSP
jgi:hypothetical protein